MKTDKVDAAFDTVKQSHQFICMSRRIIHSFEHNVFERNSALATQIPTADFPNHFSDGINTLDGHNFLTFHIKWRMKTNCQMRLTFFEKSNHCRNYSNRRYSNSFWTPTIP